MGRIAAVTNLKGGIGKTTTVINLGAGFALKGLRVLLVDADAQGNLAISLGVKPRRTLYEVLVDNLQVAECVTPARPNLMLLAADDSLLSAQTAIASRGNWSRVLEKALVSVTADYDVILIDVPGSLTPMSINAIVAARDLVVPTTVEPLSLNGLSLLFKQVTRVKNGSNSIRAIVPTMFDGRMRQSLDLLMELKQRYGQLVTPPIRVNVRLSEAVSIGKTIYEYDPRSRGSLDYAHLVEQLSDLWGLQSVKAAPHTHNYDHPALPVAPPAPRVQNHVPVAPAAAIQASAASEVPPEPIPNHHTAVVTKAPSTAEPVRRENNHHNHQPPVVTGTHGVSHPCPLCNHPLRRTIIAGYRVAYCDHCKYIEQELATGVRR